MSDSTLLLQVVDVDGKFLGEKVDNLLRHQTDGNAIKVQAVADSPITITDLLNGVYSVQVHSPSYRPVGLFAMVGDGVKDPDALIFSVDPLKVIEIDAPAFDTLRPDVQRILQASNTVKNFGGVRCIGA
jgi:hypothetical protein